MKRFRLSTLMLLIVIIGLGIGLMIQHHRAARSAAELQARLDETEKKVFWLEHYQSLSQWRAAVASRSRSRRRPSRDQAVEKASDR
jgi:hypothetical protein